MLGSVERELALGNDLTQESIQRQCAVVEEIGLDTPLVEQEAETFDASHWEQVRSRAGLTVSATDCRLAWRNQWRPSLRQGPFGPEDDEQLRGSVARHGTQQVRVGVCDLY